MLLELNWKCAELGTDSNVTATSLELCSRTELKFIYMAAAEEGRHGVACISWTSFLSSTQLGGPAVRAGRAAMVRTGEGLHEWPEPQVVCYVTAVSQRTPHQPE